MKTNFPEVELVSYSIYRDHWFEFADILKIKPLNVVADGPYVSNSNLMNHIEEICANNYMQCKKTRFGYNSLHITLYKPALLIEADTGTGKTHFINDVLVNLA